MDVAPLIGFVSGLAHPVGGLDHLLAMAAIGFWGAQLGGRAVWAVPAAFLAAMVAGGALGGLGIDLPAVEAGIGASVIVLGALIALRPKLPAWAPVVVAALFALFHGHAHGVEMPGAASPWAYTLGFLTATAVLHAFGASLARVFARVSGPRLVRLGGVACAAAGGVILAF